MTIEEQIEQIEEEIRKTPHHKGTNLHLGILRARISKLKEKQAESQSRKTGGGGGYGVKKQGDATVVLVGPPSAGKSTLLNTLTNAESKVAPYAFTTVSVIPGMMKYRDAYIQILDVPGLIEGAEEGKGRGREVISVVRGADLLILMSDVKRPEAITRNMEALERNGIRVDKLPPDVLITKNLNGGLFIKSNLRQDLEKEEMKEIIWELGIKNAEVALKENITIERLIDSFSKNRVYIPSLKVLNKAEEINFQYPDPQYLLISADQDINLDKFREAIWQKLNLSRIYLVRRDEEPNTNNPLIIKKGINLKEVALKIGPEFAEEKKKAKIWGNGSKYEGQEVSMNHKSEEGMFVRFI